MPNCLNRDVVASRRLPLEEALSIYILPTAGCLPIYLLFILVRHETKEITAHVVIIEVGLVFVLPAVYELIRQCVNEKPPYRDIPFSFPRPHHPAEGNQISIAGGIFIVDGFYLWPRIRCAPPPATI